MFIDTTDKIIKTNEYRTLQQNLKYHSQQIILFSYIQFFALIDLMKLEPSTSLTPQYAVALSLCHRTRACCFAATRRPLSLVSTRILRWTIVVSPWEYSVATRFYFTAPPWGDPPNCGDCPWVHSLCTSERCLI